MKLVLAPALLLLAACTATSGAATRATDSTSHTQLSLYLGQRALEEDDYAPVDEQAMIAGEVSNVPASTGGLGWELGLAVSADEDDVAGVDVNGRTGEFYGGVRTTFGSGTLHPYLGAGLSLVAAAVEVAGAGDEDDGSLAAYVHGGVLLAPSPKFAFGLDARVLLGSDLEIAGVDTDADYAQLALVLAFEL